jgi:hypothetical protein
MTTVTLRCLSKKTFWITVVLAWINQLSKMDNWLVSNDKYILTEVPPIVGMMTWKPPFLCTVVFLSCSFWPIPSSSKCFANEGFHYQLWVCRIIRSLGGNINIQERKAQYPERDVEGLHPWDLFLWLKYSVELYNYSQFYLFD